MSGSNANQAPVEYNGAPEADTGCESKAARVVLAFFLPPLSAALSVGPCTKRWGIDVALTVFTWFGGTFYSLYLIGAEPREGEKGYTGPATAASTLAAQR